MNKRSEGTGYGGKGDEWGVERVKKGRRSGERSGLHFTESFAVRVAPNLT